MKQSVGEKILEILIIIGSAIGTFLAFIGWLIWKLVSGVFMFIVHLIADILTGVRGRIVQAGSALLFFALIAYILQFAIK